MSFITTARLIVCGKCGYVSHVEGTVQPAQAIHSSCLAVPSGVASTGHAWTTVVVMVPYA